MMLAVLFALVAVATADQTLSVNGREFRVYDAKKTYAQAEAACAASGTVLATICSEEELNTFRTAGYSAPVTTEYWIGLPSDLNHHSMISADKFATITSGNRCRIMSNWASRPWNVFTKDCTGTRSYICEVDDDGVCPEFFDVNGHEFMFHKAKKSYTAAKAACEADGQVLATICNQQELDAIRATGYTAPVTTEFWIGLPSSQNHHSMIQPAQLSVMDSGDRCRILSNWASKPWNIFTKDCNPGERFYICEAGETETMCPVSLDVEGHEFVIHKTKKSYIDAMIACEGDDQLLATICSQQELDAIRATGYTAPVTTEHWIGLPSSQNHHSMIQPEQFAVMNTGDRCRILSNWASKPWNIFTKDCDQGERFYICEVGEKMERCPAPKPEPLIEVLPEPKPEVQVPEVPEVFPELPEVIPELPEVIPEEPEVIPELPEVFPELPEVFPEEPEVFPEPETCLKEREAFKANGLPVEPSFEKGSCRYLAKQCNDEKCFCVSPKKGVRQYGKLEVPLGQDFDCTSKARKCHVKHFAILIKQAEGKEFDYLPSCTKRGQYEKKQCDKSGACWCAKKLGKEIKKTRNANGTAVKC